MTKFDWTMLSVKADVKVRPAWARFAVAIGCVLAGWLAREALNPVVGPTALPFIFFFPAITIAAWYGGLRPGCLAALLSTAAADWFFLEPLDSLWLRNSSDFAALVAFLGSCLFIIGAMEAMHRANAETSRQKELLATTLASIGDGVIATDPVGRVVFLNAEAERLTGWQKAEAASQPLAQIFRIINEQTRQPAENPVEKVLRLGTVVGLANHTLLLRKDGVEIPIDDSAAPIRLPGCPLLGTVLVFRDFSEQRKAQITNARLGALVEFSGDAIFTKNLDGVIQTCNATAERLFGYRAEEIVGKPVTILIPPDHLREEEHILERLRQGLPPERLETIRVAKDGRRIPVLLTVSPIKDSDGNVIGASKVIRDITERKRAEEALRDAHDQLASRAVHLDKLVQQRTARLNEIVGDMEAFSYSIVHDLRAPLRAIRSFAQLLVEECAPTSSTAESHVRRIKTAAQRMDHLIQDVLNYSRVMRAELPLAPTDVGALLRGMIETYPAFQPPHAEIQLENDFPLVRANEAALTQCISNLLGNAVKFVAPGVTPCVRVWAEAHDAQVRFFFKDNGIGIEQEVHDKIFQIFQRLDTKYEGTGIGLAIVKKAAERMGGSVGVESALGCGSTFWLELPSGNDEITRATPQASLTQGNITQ